MFLDAEQNLYYLSIVRNGRVNLTSIISMDITDAIDQACEVMYQEINNADDTTKWDVKYENEVAVWNSAKYNLIATLIHAS